MTILKENTVMPGEWIGGTIVLAQPEYADKASSAGYSIAVNFGGELHEITIAHRKM
jgi:hypothetical protein